MPAVNKNYEDIITFTRASGGGVFNANGDYEWLGNDIPRFDYDPITKAVKGLLIEEQRTNLLTYSEQFDNAAWGKVRTTVSANATTAPNGTLSADKLTEDTQSGTHYLDASNVTTTAQAVYTGSVFVKAGGRARIVVYLVDSGIVTGTSSHFDLAAGVVLSGVQAGIQAIGNGWYRCWVYGTVTGSAARMRVVLDNGTIDNYTGDGTSGLYIYGALS